MMNAFTRLLCLTTCISNVAATNILEFYPSIFSQNTGNNFMAEIRSFQPSPIKSGDTIDYRLSRVADVEGKNTVSINSVLHDIHLSLSMSPYNPMNLTINLSENYISSDGFKELVDFLSSDDNQIFAARIKHLDLSNNRIDLKAEEDISRLLNKFPLLTLDLSINYLNLSELKNLDKNDLERITLRAY